MSHRDVGGSRAVVHRAGLRAGLAPHQCRRLILAFGEIGANAVRHAGGGWLVILVIRSVDRRGVRVLVRDEGPGLGDFDHAVGRGVSTVRGLGLGLGAARRLVDEFEITSAPGSGTTICLGMWAAP